MVFKKQNPARNPLIGSAAIEVIELSAINRANDTFRITTNTDIDELVASIPHMGLMHPPILKRNASGYIIVSGFRRIEACRRLGWVKTPAQALNPEYDMSRCAQLAIADNAFQRSLNLVETSRSLNLLSGLMQNEKALAEVASELGLPASPSAIRKIEKICNLPWPIQESIIANTVTLPMALELGGFEPDIGTALVKIFEQLTIGLNKQRELILLIKEVALLEDIPIQELLAEENLTEILRNNELDGPQRRQRIRLYLRQRRFPTILKAEKEFKKHVKQLKLNKDIKLTPPKDFEATTYTMTLRFENLAELKQLQARLDKIIQHSSLAKILD